jgi:SAM-dependent methyltransferase
MDFRGIASPKHVQAARRLAFRGLLNYQPFTFSERLAVGSGLSILAGHARETPSIYCPDASAGDADPEFLSRQVATDPGPFFEANAAMRRFYDGLVEEVIGALGSVERQTVLDVGCNSGYFPLAFARRGAIARGLDSEDYSDTIKLLNSICGTKVRFDRWRYDGATQADSRFDLVLSVAVLVHLSEPLRHLAWLGSAARRALLVLTPCHAEDDLSIRFHAANRYYTDARFPGCFDVTTVSQRLLRFSLEKMGFNRIVDLSAPSRSMPPHWTRDHLALLGIRD